MITITSHLKQVLYWMALGKSNYEIGVIMGCSEFTVKNHVAKILKVYGTPSRIGAVMTAMARGDVKFEEVMKDFA